jgi:ADP-ribose pyrophosphatase YjhB (NUDIX family)
MEAITTQPDCSAQVLGMARRMHALAHTGLHYAEDDYNRERYQELKTLAQQIMSVVAQVPLTSVQGLFAAEQGYFTPKIDVRAVVLHEGRLLLARERSDGCWALPGGYAEVGYSPSAVAVKEVQEETGLEVVPVRLLAVLDANRHDFPPLEHHFYKIVVLCTPTGGCLRGSNETLGAGFFSPEELPPLSLKRNTPEVVRLLLQCVAEGVVYWD